MLDFREQQRVVDEIMGAETPAQALRVLKPLRPYERRFILLNARDAHGVRLVDHLASLIIVEQALASLEDEHGS